MKQRLFILFVILATSVCIVCADSNDCLIASGYCGAEGDSTNLRWELSCDSVLTISGTGAMEDYQDTASTPWRNYRFTVIKRVVMQEGITSIGTMAFGQCCVLESVSIPHSVTRIGDEAFFYCGALASITIPNSVEFIGKYAFASDKSLSEILVEEGNPVYSSEAGVLFRSNATALVLYPTAKQDSIYFIPEHCDTICNGAFGSCANLQSIVFSRCPAYMQYAFSTYYNSYDLHVPCGMKELFLENTGLPFDRIVESENMPTFAVNFLTEGNGYVNSEILQQSCEGTELSLRASNSTGYYFVSWSDSVTDNPRTVYITQDTTFTAIFAPHYYTLQVYSSDTTKGVVNAVNGSYAYGTTVSITATPFEGFAFKGWNDAQLTFPCQAYSVTRSYRVTGDIEISAIFGELEEPRTGTCGDSITWEFGCDGVLTISGSGPMPDWASEKETPWYNTDTHLGAKGHFPIRSVVIEEGITHVGVYAFRRCSTIVSVSLPSSLISIGKEAFRYAAITSLTIPSNVTTIESGAFYDANLHTVTCCAVTPPTNSGEQRFFSTSSSNIFTLYVPCGAVQAYKSSRVWKNWPATEGAFNYSVGNAIILQEPTCFNNSTLIFQAKERAGYFFTQWSDGNTDNPRSVQLETGARFDVEAQYVAGVAETVCSGYVWEENGEQIVINQDTVIGYRHFFLYTKNLPELTEDEWPVLQSGRIYYAHAEQCLRQKFAQVNRYAPSVETVAWTLIPTNGNIVAQYSMVTSCGDTLQNTVPILEKETVTAPAQWTTWGKDFWLGLTLAATADSDFTLTPFLTISTTGLTIVKISNPNNGWQIVREINGTVDITDIPLECWYPLSRADAHETAKQAGTTHALGLHIEASRDISVIATHYMSMSMDATSVLPADVLKSAYIIQDYPSYNNSDVTYATFTVLAVEDNTIVDIIPSSTTIDGHEVGSKYTIILNRGQVYYVVSQNQQSLSGTYVNARAGKPIAVFQGDVLTQVPAGISARDCLFEQAIPVEYWGTEFIVTRSLQKDANRVRVTASEDATRLLINNQKEVILNAGETYEFEMSLGDLNRQYNRLIHSLPDIIQFDAVFIEASMPVAVYSYDVGGNYEAVSTEMNHRQGDPSMVWIAPLDKMTNSSISRLLNTSRTSTHFINIVASTANCYATTLVGLSETNAMYDLSCLLEWLPVPSRSEYSYARVALENMPGIMALSLSNPVGCVAHVYGHGDNESYAYYAGGMTRPKYVIAPFYSCLNEPAYFELMTNVSVDRVDWDFGDGNIQQEASSSVEHMYAQPGTYDVKAKVYTHREAPVILYAPEELMITITINRPDTFYSEYTMCHGESFIHNGRLYDSATQDTVAFRCDSIEIFTLEFSDCSVEAKDTVVVEPEETSADITWTIIPGTEYYVLVIWANPEHTVRLCTLTFNAAGYLISIDFGVPTYAPAYALNQRQAPNPRRAHKQNSVGTTTLDFTITGLESDHSYYYELFAYDAKDEELDAKEGTFITAAPITTDLWQITTDGTEVKKVLINHLLYILRGDKLYSLQGVERK